MHIFQGAHACILYFRDTGRLTQLQIRHNRTLSACRVVIENAFGILKGRWRVLSYIDVGSVKRAVLIASACIFLHNFCLLNLDDFEDIEVLSMGQVENINEDYSEGGDEQAGIAKRDIICSQL